MIPERALELVVPESAPSRAALTGVAVVQIRENHCNQVLPVMHQGRQEGEMVRPNRGLNDVDNDCNGVDATIDVESCFCILWPLPNDAPGRALPKVTDPFVATSSVLV